MDQQWPRSLGDGGAGSRDEREGGARNASDSHQRPGSIRTGRHVDPRRGRPKTVFRLSMRATAKHSKAVISVSLV